MAALLVLLFVQMVLVTRLLCRDSVGYSTFWAPNGALVAALLLLPRRTAMAALAAAFALNVAINLLFSYSLFINIQCSLLNILLAVTTAGLMRRFCGAALDLSRFDRFASFALIAMVSSAFEAGVGELLELAAAEGTPGWSDWLQWTVGDGLGLLVSTPAILLVAKRRRFALGFAGRTVERWLLFAITIAGAVLAFDQNRSPAFLWIYPLLILTAFRSGPAWVLASVATVSMIASAFSAHGLGPLAFMAPGPRFLRQDTVQPFILSLFCATLPANNALGERLRALQRLKRLNTVARRAQAEAMAANAAKTRFVAHISHEIRTPMNGVLGMAQALALGELSPHQREQLVTLKASGEALLTLLNDVLDVSKIEAGRLSIERTAFSIQHVAEDVIKIFTPVAEGRRVALSLEIEEGVRGRYIGDPYRIRQILSNLVSNAVKFTPAGEVRVIVSILGGDLRVEVRDTGIGIAAEKFTTLFNEFEQGDDSTTRRFGGTGLGLCISRQLATLMQGALHVDSIVGQGSTFTLTLPAEPAAAEEPRTDTAPLEAPASHERPIRVLAAEDNRTNQVVLKALLGELKMSVSIVGDGQQAVSALSDADFDLILLDIQMPVMDGLTAARTIRAREIARGASRTPILAFTADVMTHHIEEYRKVGIDGVISKPVQLTQLMGAIAGVLAVENERGSSDLGPAATAGRIDDHARLFSLSA